MVIPPDIIYEETSGDMMVPEGGSAKLVCKARGYPPPKILWRREDGGDIISRSGPQGKTKGANKLFIIEFCLTTIILIFFHQTITDSNIKKDYVMTLIYEKKIFKHIYNFAV